MINEQLILSVERFRDDVRDFRSALRKKYKKAAQQVTSQDLKRVAGELAERWVVNFAESHEIYSAVSSRLRADLNIHFQRLLTFSEQASKRSRYDSEIKAILNILTVDVVFRLKQERGSGQVLPAVISAVGTDRGSDRSDFYPAAFVAHSFAPRDQLVVDCVTRTLKEIGIKVVTGARPRADYISEKVKNLIDRQYLFVGVFTRREKISRQAKWVTSPWLIDEKAYAVAKKKKLILLKEVGVDSIGGIQGDYQFVDFSRDRLHDLTLSVLQVFDLSVTGLRL